MKKGNGTKCRLDPAVPEFLQNFDICFVTSIPCDKATIG